MEPGLKKNTAVRIERWYVQTAAVILSGAITILLYKNHKPTVSAKITTIIAIKI